MCLMHTSQIYLCLLRLSTHTHLSVGLRDLHLRLCCDLGHTSRKFSSVLLGRKLYGYEEEGGTIWRHALLGRDVEARDIVVFWLMRQASQQTHTHHAGACLSIETNETW